MTIQIVIIILIALPLLAILFKLWSMIIDKMTNYEIGKNPRTQLSHTLIAIHSFCIFTWICSMSAILVYLIIWEVKSW